MMVCNYKDLKGIQVADKEFRLSQYADDTVLFIDGSEKSIQAACNNLDLFANMSGLKVNVDKTDVVWIG